MILLIGLKLLHLIDSLAFEASLVQRAQRVVAAAFVDPMMTPVFDGPMQAAGLSPREAPECVVAPTEH